MEGYWINGANNKYYLVDEHAHWLQQGQNAKKLGMSPKEIKQIKSMERFDATPREKMLKMAMKHGAVRMRSHGTEYTFEFIGSPEQALWSSYNFLKKEDMAGPYTVLGFYNLKNNDDYVISYNDFEQKMTDVGPSGVMRTAKKEMKFHSLKNRKG